MFLLPRRIMGYDRSTRRIGSGQLRECEPLAKRGSGGNGEPSGIGQLATIEPESLLIEVTKQVECSTDT